MTRLASAFARGPALVTFVTGGDGPTDAILDALVAGGVHCRVGSTVVGYLLAKFGRYVLANA